VRLVIFSRSFYPRIGGLERIAELIARHASDCSHCVEIVTDTPNSMGTDDHVFPFTITRTTSLITRFLAFRRADAILFMNVSLIGLVPAIMAARKVVFSHQSNYRGSGHIGTLLEWIKRETTRFFSNISASEFTASMIPGHSTVIPNAYDETLFYLPQGVRRDADFVFCGRLVSDKGAELAVRALGRVASMAPDTNLTIVGDGPERRSLERLVSSLGLEGRVHFLGALEGESLAGELRRHRCMVVPSIWEEPFGIVALEGLACCDAVIVTKRGGLPEAVGPCGIVVEPHVEEIADAMLSVCRSGQQGTLARGEMELAVRAAHLRAHQVRTVGKRYLEVLGLES
jgi:glycogen(starch) synthase